MNPTRLLNPSDENSILITAEFYEDGYRLRTDRTRVHRYELDLIVPNDITLNQLLEAIQGGIYDQLKEQYQIDWNDLTSNPAYLDTIQRFEQLLDAYAQDHKKTFWPQQHPNPLGFQRARKDASVAAMAAEDKKKAGFGPASGEEDLWRWLICADVFERCFHQYQEGYPVHRQSIIRNALLHAAPAKHPVISCGNIAYFIGSDKDHQPVKAYTQKWLQQKENGSKTLRDLGFSSSSRLIFDPYCYHTAPPRPDAVQLQFPLDEQYQLSNTRRSTNINTITHTVRIQSPSTLGNPPAQPIFLALGALLVSALAFFPAVLLSLFSGIIPLNVQMPLLYINILISLILGWFTYRKLCTLQQQQTYRHYESYIQDLLHHLRLMQIDDIKFLTERYPPVYSSSGTDNLLERTFRTDGTIYSRKPDHSDFLRVRIGVSQTGSKTAPAPVQFEFQAPSGEFSAIRYKNLLSNAGLPFRLIAPSQKDTVLTPNDGTSGYINSLGEDIRDAYAWLDCAPVLMDLHHSRSMGVYFQNQQHSLYPLLNNLIFDLCYNHSPDDLQIVMFAPKLSSLRERQTFIRQFKQLPHFNRLLPNQSQFVFDAQYAEVVMDRLYRLYMLRQNDSLNTQKCHILVLFLAEYGLRFRPLSDLLPSSAEESSPKNNDLTFLFLTHYESMLPPYCSHILKVDNSRNCYYIPYLQNFTPGASSQDPSLERDYGIVLDDHAHCFMLPGAANEHDRMYQAFQVLSSLTPAAEVSLPRQIDLYRVLELAYPDLPTENWFHMPPGNTKADWVNVLESRLKKFVEEQWAASERSAELNVPIGVSAHGPLWLDLLQYGHLLIASDPGMGKTESLTTILQSLCLHYSPQSVQMYLIDLREGGIRKRLSHLPHTVLSLDETVVGGFYAALQQLFANLKAEVQNRSALFNAMNVRNIHSYNTTLLTSDVYRKSVGQSAHPKRMPHLILAIDHADLIEEHLRNAHSNQAFLQDLQWLLQVGSDYGIHVILASEHPHDILPKSFWSYLPGRLCLRTEDASLSEEMLRSTSACIPSMPGDGRAWLYDDTTGDAIYAQIALYPESDDAVTEIPFRVTLMEPGGSSQIFFDSNPSDTGPGVQRSRVNRHSKNKPQKRKWAPEEIPYDDPSAPNDWQEVKNGREGYRTPNDRQETRNSREGYHTPNDRQEAQYTRERYHTPNDRQEAQYTRERYHTPNDRQEAQGSRERYLVPDDRI